MGPFVYTGFSEAVKLVHRANQQVPPAIIKPLTLDNSSSGASDVEKGNKLYLSGKFKEASKAYDDAAEKDQDSTVPWLNGALAAKELGKLGVAKLAVNTASKMGDRSARGKVISGDIDIAKNSFDNAKAKFGQALFTDPNDSFGLLGLAKTNMFQAKLREGERYMWQGYRDGAPVVLDSKFNNEKSYSNSFGNNEGHITAGLQSGGSQYSVATDGGYIDQMIGAANALQQLTKLNFALDTPFGVLAGNHRYLLSGRPGATDPTLVLPSTPGSELDFRHNMIGLQNRFGHWTTHVNYRDDLSKVRPDGISPFTDDNRLHQWILETRYDSGPWMGGFGYSKVTKTSVATPGIEPLEAIFPQGVTNMYNAYLVNRSMLNKNMSLTSGAIFTSAAGTDQANVTAQLAIRLMGNRYLKIGVKPGMNRVQTNLGPIGLMSDSLVDNPIDRTFGSALEFNREAALPALNARLQNAYLSLPLMDSPLASAAITVFQNTFSNYRFLASDPVTNNTLMTTPVSRGTVSGAGVEGTVALSNAVNLRFGASVQSSTGTYNVPTLSIDTGVAVSVKTSQVPNIPRVSASASFDWSSPTTTMTLTTNYVGPRIQAVPNISNAGLPPGTYITNAKSALSMDAHFSMAIGGGESLVVSLLNLNNVNFYPGFRSSRQIMIGYTSRQ